MRCNYSLITWILTCLLFQSTGLADNTSHIVIDDWQAAKLCNRPAPLCCLGSNCSTLNPDTCSQTAGNQISAYCSSNPTTNFAWSGATPCSIVGSYRDIGLKASNDCSTNPQSVYTSARVNPLCAHLLIEGNQVLGLSQTRGSGSIVWDFSSFPKDLSDLDINGLANSQVVSAIGQNIRIGSGRLNIPVCHKINAGDPRPELRVSLYFADGTNYLITPTQNSNLLLSTTSCASVDNNLNSQCPVLNSIQIDIPTNFYQKELSAIKIDFDNVSKLFIGQITLGCSASSPISSNGMASGPRSFSCANNLPACVNPTATPTSVDCTGVIGGNAKLDNCGVCNGDGTTCAGCQSTEIKGIQKNIDSAADALRNQAFKALQQLSIAVKNAKLSAKDSKSFAAYAENSRSSIGKNYSEAWSEIWKIPSISVSCSSTLCASVSNQEAKSKIEKANATLLNIIKNTQSKIIAVQAKAKKNKGANLNAINKTITQAKSIYNQSLNFYKKGKDNLSQIPAQHSRCN